MNKTNPKQPLGTKKIAVTALLKSRNGKEKPILALDIFDAVDKNQAIGRMYMAYDKWDRQAYYIDCIATQIV